MSWPSEYKARIGISLAEDVRNANWTAADVEVEEVQDNSNLIGMLQKSQVEGVADGG